jgi:hypothetical protein
MPRILAIAYNTGSTITGTFQYGDIAVQNIEQDYSGRPGNVDWWGSPDLDARYVICFPVPAGDHPTAIPGVFSYIGFWGTSAKTENDFLTLSNKIPPRKNETPFTTANQAYDWLVSNGYWTSFEPVLESESIDFGTTIDSGSVKLDFVLTASTATTQDITISFKTILNDEIQNFKFDTDVSVTILSGRTTGATSITLTEVIPENQTIGYPIDYENLTKGFITITDISSNRPDLTFNKYAYVNFVNHTPNFGSVIFQNCCRTSVNPPYITVLVDSKTWLTEEGGIIIYNGSCYTYLEPGTQGPNIGYYYGPDYVRGCGFVLCEDCDGEETPTPTPTKTPTPTPTKTPTSTPGASPTPTPSTSSIPGVSPTPTPTVTPTGTLCGLNGEFEIVTCTLDGEFQLVVCNSLDVGLTIVNCTIVGAEVSVTEGPTPTPSVTPTNTPTSDFVRTGLIIQLEADSSVSYPGTGTTVFDLTTNSYNHTLTDGASFTTLNGIKCFDCTSSTERVVVNGTGPTLPTSGYTYITWARVEEDNPLSFRTLLYTNSPKYTPITIPNGTNTLGYWDTEFRTSGYDLSSSVGVWVQYAIVGDSSSQTFYINGSQVGSSIAFGSGGRTHWGWGNNNVPQPWGYVANLYLYDRKLSLSEISQQYNFLASRFVELTPTPTPTNTQTPTVTPTKTPTPTPSSEILTGFSYNLVALPYEYPSSGNSIISNVTGINSGDTNPNVFSFTGSNPQGFFFSSIDSISIDRTSYFSGFVGQELTITLTQDSTTVIYSGDSNSFQSWTGMSGNTGYVFGEGINQPGFSSGTTILIQSASTQWVIGREVQVSIEEVRPCLCYENITINYSCRTGICPSTIDVEYTSCDGEFTDIITVDIDVPFVINRCVDSTSFREIDTIESNYNWEYDYSIATLCC